MKVKEQKSNLKIATPLETLSKRDNSEGNKIQHKDHRGITLIALIITIIVMLILVAVTVSVALNGGLISKAQEAKTKTEEAQIQERDILTGRIKIGGTWYDSLDKYLAGEKSKNQSDVPGEEPEAGEWTQDKITVTNGVVTLTVGQPVTGYKVTVGEKEIGDGNWYVLGAEDGKLLITTNTNQEEITLEGKDGYVNGVEILNNAGAKYSDGKMAESARSINVEDINRVTGYDPASYEYEDDDLGTIHYGDEIVFTLKDDGYVYVSVQGKQGQGDEVKTNLESFEYWDEESKEWLQLSDSCASVSIPNTGYSYYPQTLSTMESDEKNIGGMSNSEGAYNLLFAKTNVASNSFLSYWLANRAVHISNPSALQSFTFDGGLYRLMGVGNGVVISEPCSSFDIGFTFGPVGAIRPVAVLNLTVSVSDDGNLSLWFNIALDTLARKLNYICFPRSSMKLFLMLLLLYQLHANVNVGIRYTN